MKMRKLVTLGVFFLVLFAGNSLMAQTAAKESAANQEANAQLQKEEVMVAEESSVPEFMRGVSGKLLMYFPNRLVDLLDTFSLELESGCAAGVTCRFTYGFGLVGEIGAKGSLIKGYNRQYGVALTNGYYGQFFFPMTEDLQRPISYGYVNKFWEEGSNYPLPSDRIFENGSGSFDYWAIEFGAICLVGAKVAVHPLEIVDFFAGLILLDPRGDDYKLTPFTY